LSLHVINAICPLHPDVTGRDFIVKEFHKVEWIFQ